MAAPRRLLVISAFLAALVLSGSTTISAAPAATPAPSPSAFPAGGARSIDQIASDQSETRSGRMRTTSPEGDPWPDTPWSFPAWVDPDEAAEVTATMRSAVTGILTQVGVQLPIVETDCFLVTTDLDRAYLASWLPDLDDACRRMLSFLGVSTRQPPFPGKIAVIVLGDHDRFRLMNAAAFDQSVPDGMNVIMHARGSQTFVIVHDDHGQPDVLRDQIHLGAARAILHLHHAPRRLPLWANEGLAEVMSAAAAPDSPRTARVRAHGASVIRRTSLREVAELFTLGYEQEPWPQSETSATAVGSLAIRLMHQDRPAAMQEWIRAVKLGKPWREALRSDFGTTPDQLVQTVHQFFLVNN